MSLKQVGLRASNLNYANLKNADLSNADLRDSSLVRAELSGANLSQADLSGADLSRANLATAQLIETDLTGACLNQACLTAAKLIKVDLSSANLSGAYLLGVDLSQTKLKGAFYDDQTSFPNEFDPLSTGMLPDYKIEKLLAQFNHICNCSNKYLGNKMTTKYFDDSRPNFDWLNYFQLDESNQITFIGEVADSVSSLQLLWFQKWHNLIKSLSHFC